MIDFAENCQKVDLHLHSTASDGGDTPKELLQKLIDRRFAVFALTDHDTIQGCLEISSFIPENIQFIPGIEFSCKTEVGKCHILGYGIDFENPIFQRAIEEGNTLRKKNLERRLLWLQEQYGFVFPEEELTWLHSLGSAGKPHLAELLIRHGYAASITEAIQGYINGCRSGNDRISAETAIHAIRSAGGIAVWAHPLGGEGEKRLSPERFQDLFSFLLKLGIQGLECFYSRYNESEEQFLFEQAKNHALFISGGSDYHGKNKTVKLGELNTEGNVIPPSQLSILSALKLP